MFEVYSNYSIWFIALIRVGVQISARERHVEAAVSVSSSPIKLTRLHPLPDALSSFSPVFTPIRSFRCHVRHAGSLAEHGGGGEL